MDVRSSSGEGAEPAPDRPRHAIALAVVRARWQAWGAARRERSALERLGAALACDRIGGVGGQALRDGLAEVRRRDGESALLRAALDASLDEDRRDFAEAHSWLRPLVVVRGMATRCLLRDRLRRARADHRAAHRALGRAVLDEGIASSSSLGAVAVEANAARAHSTAVADELEQHLRLLRPTRLGAVARFATREAAALGTPLVREVRGRLVPRVPGLAGLAVGWWIASTFTDSRLTGLLHSLGIGSGARRVVSTQQLRAMEFWLPLLAAAVCSYAGTRAAALIRARYLPAPQSSRRADDRAA